MNRSPNFLTATLSQKVDDAKASTLSKLGEVCGYRLAFVPIDQLTDTMIVIDTPST